MAQDNTEEAVPGSGHLRGIRYDSLPWDEFVLRWCSGTLILHWWLCINAFAWRLGN